MGRPRQPFARRSFDSLWKQYLLNSSNWWAIQKSIRLAAFKHRALQKNGSHTPSRVDEELSSGAQAEDETTHFKATRSAQAPDAEFSSYKEEITNFKVQDEALCPNNPQASLDKFADVGIALLALIRACAKYKDLHRGTLLHIDVSKHSCLEQFADPLIIMYAKCGAVAKAQELLDMHRSRNVLSWTALIAGFAHKGQDQDVLHCFERMQQEGLSPDAVTFAFILKACGSLRAIHIGEQIHDEISRKGLLCHDIVLGNILMDMYAKCGAPSKAHRVLKELPVRTIVSWSTVITGYVQQGQGKQALNCFEQMQCEGLSPNAVTFSSILKACASIGAAKEGQKIHNEINRQGLLGRDVVLATALVDMYVKCGALARAQQVLEDLPVRNLTTWNALIAGYAQQGQGKQALNCFRKMQFEGFSPNSRTYTSVLNACASMGEIFMGEEIYNKIDKHGMLKTDVMLGNAVVDMYAKCGDLRKAQQVLNKLPVKNVVAWNALIAGYVEQGQGEQALDCFDQMQREELHPNAVTLLCTLRACGNVGAASKGEEIYKELAAQRLTDNDVVLGNAVVDMYVKLGALKKAQDVLEKLLIRNVVTWSTLIAGYALHGRVREAMSCVERMQSEGLSPNAVTLLCILKACGSRGLVDDAETYFVSMSTTYGIHPNLEHYICMIDVYGRVGLLDKAVKMSQEMPCFENAIELWSVLLGACRRWGDVNVGRWAFDQAVKVDKTDAAAYILMANLYIDAGQQKEAEKVEAMRVENQAEKKPSCEGRFNASMSAR